MAREFSREEFGDWVLKAYQERNVIFYMEATKLWCSAASGTGFFPFEGSIIKVIWAYINGGGGNSSQDPWPSLAVKKNSKHMETTK